MYQQRPACFKLSHAAFALAALVLMATCARAQDSISVYINTNAASAATNDEAPDKQPLPTAERVGVDADEPLSLTLNDAIRLALENNNDIDASRIDVEMAEHDLTAARGVYDMRFSSETYFQRSSTPVAAFLGGTTAGKLKETDLTGKLSLSGLSPWAGGSYQFDFSSRRLSTNNFFNGLNPSFSTEFKLTYTQPLMRGRKTDDNRRRIEIARKNLSLTDVQFRQRATEVITRVEQAYWELVYALRNLQVQTDAVKQARAQVETNRRQVKQGVLAPIDVVEAEAQVKNFEQHVYAAQEEVTRAENSLKTLFLPDRNADAWSRPLVPVTPINLDAPRIPLAEALNTALSNRLELAELRTNAEANQINTRYYRDQTKPQVDLTASYSSNGLAGSLIDNDENPLFASLTSLEQRLNELSALAGLPGLPPGSFGAVSNNLSGGYGQSLTNLLGQKNPTVQVGVSVELPFKNRTANARLGHSLAEGRRIETLRLKAEQLIEADVRNTMQAVRSVEARLAAASAARNAAEQQYTSEQRKFQSGTSTVYLVLQRQLELVEARGRELQTQTDLNKAVANLQRAMGNTFQYRSIAVRSEGQRLLQISEPDEANLNPVPTQSSATVSSAPSITKTNTSSAFMRSQQ
jgi:Outer membrane protein